MAPATDKAKAWEACSRYCKVRDCLQDRNYAFLGICITCGRPYHISVLQAGHALSGRGKAVLFDVELIHTQCYHCNVIEHGQPKLYRKIMVERHGEEWMAKKERRAKRAVKNNIDYAKMRAGMNRKYKKLMLSHGYKTWSQLLQDGQG